ncbi:PREDICTED: uncharacterized protein LOC104785054 [Camelina sativa]|uniref:Uncharacterized protein LOC104785054 n=1 Tax=Camelina sativa TaxID=90675 RepID=A0ABM0Z009_CAMSA|nr:PREDICTED: uncharacterized protein LOC104785054 [Camelina sativa]
MRPGGRPKALASGCLAMEPASSRLAPAIVGVAPHTPKAWGESRLGTGRQTYPLSPHLASRHLKHRQKTTCASRWAVSRNSTKSYRHEGVLRRSGRQCRREKADSNQ